MASSAKDFKAKSRHTITLPSGSEMVVRRVGVEQFLASGKVPNALMPMMTAMFSGKGAEAIDSKELNPEMVADMLAMFDLVLVAMAVDPPVSHVPSPDENGERWMSVQAPDTPGRIRVPWVRSDEILYTDEVDNNDKQFLFQFAVGGTANAEKFLAEQSEYVAGLQQKQKVGQDTSGTDGDN